MKTYFLQMTSPDDLVPGKPVEGLAIRVVDPPDGQINQRFYREVGGEWFWTQCADWSADRWDDYLRANPITTAILFKGDEEIGFVELINRDGDVEILSFGLLPPFIGKGLGGASLELSVRLAWTLGAVHHVWLHTADNDHPNALANYQKRGFVLYDTRENEPDSRS